MSTVITQTTPPPVVGHWLRLPADGFARSASLHLLSLPELGLAPDSRDSLQEMATRYPNKLDQHLQVWVQLKGLEWVAQSKDEADKERAALELMIRRRAHFDLIKRLFRVSRRDWLELRKSLGAAAAPTAWPMYSESFVDSVFDAWAKLMHDYSSEVDRWLELSALFPNEPLACLYPIIYEH